MITSILPEHLLPQNEVKDTANTFYPVSPVRLHVNRRREHFAREMDLPKLRDAPSSQLLLFCVFNMTISCPIVSASSISFQSNPNYNSMSYIYTWWIRFPFLIEFAIWSRRSLTYIYERYGNAKMPTILYEFYYAFEFNFIAMLPH